MSFPARFTSLETAARTSDDSEVRKWAADNAVAWQMLALNAVGAAAHAGALAIEVSRGMRFGMKLELVREEVAMVTTTAPIANVAATVANLTTSVFLTYTRVHAGFVHVAAVAIAIHVVSIVFHTVVVLALTLHLATGWGGGWYITGLYRCRAPWRWAEYVMSATLMIFLIAVLVGMRDVSRLTTLCALNATTMLFGWVTEVVSSHLIVGETKTTDGPGKAVVNPRRWRSGTLVDRLVYAHLLGYVPFSVMVLTLVQSYVAHCDALGERCPPFVDQVVVGTLSIFGLFGVVQFVQQAHPRGPTWYAAGEATYVVLSFVAKAWLVVVANENALREGAAFDTELDATFD